MKTLRRATKILFWGVVLGIYLTWLGSSGWASPGDLTTVGEQFEHPIEPIRMVAGALLIAVPAVILVRAAWARLTKGDG